MEGIRMKAITHIALELFIHCCFLSASIEPRPKTAVETYMVCSTLHDHTALRDCSSYPLVEKQIDLAINHNSKIDALSPVHYVVRVINVASRGEMYGSANNTIGICQADLFGVVVNEGVIDSGRYSFSFPDCCGTIVHASLRLIVSRV